jgi:hypothetical protein
VVLRGLAADDVPAVPKGLPPPLAAMLAEVVEAVQQARDGA